jgi:3-oxoacyl-(acyl-carrier-protein) synthase
MTTEVVVTGLGATTPLGGDVTSTWDALRAGKSGVVALAEDWVDRFDLPVRSIRATHCRGCRPAAGTVASRSR